MSEGEEYRLQEMTAEATRSRPRSHPRKRVARFKVFAQLDGAGGNQHGTVEIDRDSGMMAVRVKRKRRRYTMPLSYVASMMVKAIILYDLREKRAAKRAKKRAR